MDIDEEELARRLNALDWTATEYIEPHEYVYPDPDDPPVDRGTLELCRLIHILREEDGYTKTFKHKEWTYYRVGDYRYWTMGEPPDIMMNRAEVDSPDEGR